jgi:glycosyltransferase involved in cell wall biosynthesis
MRIVELNPYHYPFMGGIEHRVHHISRELASRHEVFVVTGRLPGTPQEERKDNYDIVRLESKLLPLYNPPYITSYGVEEKLRELAPDVVDFHYRWAPSYKKAMKGYGGPKVFTFHNTFGEGEGLMKALSKLNDISYTRFVLGFDKVVCVSEFVLHDLASRGFPPSMLEAVPNGVDLPESVSQEEGDFILFLGRLVNTKGLDYLIKAMRKIDIRLVVAGTGPEHRSLKRMVEKLGLEERVSLIGRVSEEEKRNLLDTCKIFVFPSVWESYGIAAIEAMSYGKPVVASDIGGLPEVVGEAGVLVPPRNPDALVKSINALLIDDRRRRDLGKKARQRAGIFSWERTAREMERIYSEVSEGENPDR